VKREKENGLSRFTRHVSRSHHVSISRVEAPRVTQTDDFLQAAAVHRIGDSGNDATSLAAQCREPLARLSDFPAPPEIKAAAIRAIEADVNQYSITWGSKNLRNAIAARLATLTGMTSILKRRSRSLRLH
jgi:aspartate/methionine/tyrosine aminotransferase